MLSHICVVKSDYPNWNVEFFLYLSAAIRIHALELEILDYLGMNGEKGDQSIVEFLTKTVLYHFKHVKSVLLCCKKTLRCCSSGGGLLVPGNANKYCGYGPST